MNYLGIWIEKKPSIDEVKKLVALGFNAMFLPMGWFWSQVEAAFKSTLTYEEMQQETVKLMHDFYAHCSQAGIERFLIDGAWGLGNIDGNYFYRRVIEEFESKQNVFFYFGEPWESFIETETKVDDRILDFGDVNNILESRIEEGLFIIDATTRNFKLIKNWANNHRQYENVTLSSYFRQDKYWNDEIPFVWIYGQLNWHSPHSLNYRRLSKKAKAAGVAWAMLYQGNPAKWDAHGWAPKILSLLGLNKKFEAWQRKRFAKWFK